MVLGHILLPPGSVCPPPEFHLGRAPSPPPPLYIHPCQTHVWEKNLTLNICFLNKTNKNATKHTKIRRKFDPDVNFHPRELEGDWTKAWEWCKIGGSAKVKNRVIWYWNAPPSQKRENYMMERSLFTRKYNLIILLFKLFM